MSSEKIDEIRTQISLLRHQLIELQKDTPAESISNYHFKTGSEDISLLELFGDKDSLFVIHNMGTSCPYCTLWADGFNGVAKHLKNRAAIAISSPDSPEAQEEFRSGRQWDFKMISAANNSFTEDMGYKTTEGYLPGVSVFKHNGSDIQRVSDTAFGPGDDFCAVWHLLDMLPEGADGWQPQYQYS